MQVSPQNTEGRVIFKVGWLDYDRCYYLFVNIFRRPISLIRDFWCNSLLMLGIGHKGIGICLVCLINPPEKILGK